MSIKLAPSLLTADFSNLTAQVRLFERGGADFLHLDIMDGHFVPNLTFGPLIVESLRKITKIPFDVHLMVQDPGRFIKAFAAAGGDLITIHAESTPHLHRVVEDIKKLGLQAGVALNPATSLHVVEYILNEVDLVLLMTVNPGWGGQGFINKVCQKIRKLRHRVVDEKLSLNLQVDGGINLETVETAVSAGANFLVVGSALFKEKDPAQNLYLFRKKAEEVLAASWWSSSL